MSIPNLRRRIKGLTAISAQITNGNVFESTYISEDEGDEKPEVEQVLDIESDTDDECFDGMAVEPPSRPQSRNMSTGASSSFKKLKPKPSEEEKKANKTFTQMSLDEQSEFLSSEIAEKFCKWVESTGMENLRINKETLKVLFEVGMDNPSVRSLDVDIRELPTIPKSVAEVFRNYENSERAALHRQILWDAQYEKVPPRYLAFGRRHPKSHKSWKKNVKANWFTTKAVSEDIITGRALWGELLGTKVLENYCAWLRNNPHYKRPDYLQKMGFLATTKKDKQFETGEMEDEFRRSGSRNYWLFDKAKFLEEEEKFNEDLQDHPEILKMLKE